MVERLMTLIHWLRHPQDKPAYVKHYEERQDAVERRLDEISARRQRLQVEYDVRSRR